MCRKRVRTLFLCISHKLYNIIIGGKVFCKLEGVIKIYQNLTKSHIYIYFQFCFIYYLFCVWNCKIDKSAILISITLKHILQKYGMAMILKNDDAG